MLPAIYKDLSAVLSTDPDDPDPELVTYPMKYRVEGIG